MPSTFAVRKNKGHGRDATNETTVNSPNAPLGSSKPDFSDSASDENESASDSDLSVSSEYLNGLLVAAKKNISEKTMGKRKEDSDDIVMLNEHSNNE